ncbi:hypothetical protein VNO77_11570 [Canavalia gladiata]|uniref:Uncharacterized protein n=1 Tax=Canavalia gladiata TaxID=3824 RepID=A0AAN9MGZ0_CANGL
MIKQARRSPLPDFCMKVNVDAGWACNPGLYKIWAHHEERGNTGSNKLLHELSDESLNCRVSCGWVEFDNGTKLGDYRSHNRNKLTMCPPGYEWSLLSSIYDTLDIGFQDDC